MIDGAALRSHYTAFVRPDRVLLTGHSHQAWPDVARAALLECFDDCPRPAGHGPQTEGGQRRLVGADKRADLRRIRCRAGVRPRPFGERVTECSVLDARTRQLVGEPGDSRGESAGLCCLGQNAEANRPDRHGGRALPAESAGGPAGATGPPSDLVDEAGEDHDTSPEEAAAFDQLAPVAVCVGARRDDEERRAFCVLMHRIQDDTGLCGVRGTGDQVQRHGPFRVARRADALTVRTTVQAAGVSAAAGVAAAASASSTSGAL